MGDSKVSNELCKHDLEPEWCATCKHGPRKVETESVAYSFTAKWNGECAAGCLDTIEKGETIVRSTLGKNYHSSCAP